MKILKRLFFTALIAATVSSQAIAYTLPESCAYGRQERYDPELGKDLFNAILSGVDLAGEILSMEQGGGGDAAGEALVDFIASLGGLYNDYDYLRIEGPSHVLVGQPNTFKGNLWDAYANVHFHSSEDGHVGTDKSNGEANAFKTVTFDETYGAGLVWVSRPPLCSAKVVWVQKAPTLTASYNDSTRRAAFKYTVDKNSKAFLSNQPIQVNVTQGYQRLAEFTIPAGKTSGTFIKDSFELASGQVVASFSDGTFRAQSWFHRNACEASCPTSMDPAKLSQCRSYAPACR